jgi:ABC-2 type transport system ATP-binding protein
VVVAGVDLDQDPVGLRRNVGYLPENVPLYPEMRVDEFLRFRADVEEVPRGEVHARIEDVVERCLVGDVRRQVIGTLSKGYRQRVGLAGALIHQPPVLILDEPTVGLDPNQIIKVRELITELGRDHTVLLSTHILPEVEQVCERVFIIDRGRVVADGTPDALRTKLIVNPSLAVELKGANGSARAALEELPGVVGIRDRGEGRYLLEHVAGSDPREAVFKTAVEQGWVLLALTPQQASLEDVFVRLTTREDEMVPAAAEEVHDA